MYRRAVLALVVATGLAGCSGSPEPTTGAPNATGTVTGATTTPADRTAPADHTATGTVAPCSPAQTGFRLPVETRPDPLDAPAARRIATELEAAHVSELDVRPQLFPQLPDGVEALSFALADADAMDVEPVDDGYRVTVHGTARYRHDLDGTPTTVEERLDVAIYRVTPRQVVRVRGIGDLTGTVICW